MIRIMSTFWNIINNSELTTITIPNYQRDYAQGRENNKEIAENFVKDIFDALKSEKELSLGLVYGSKKDNQLLLVDGQQRFTMLWLLHIYLGKCSSNDISPLRKFYYTTRPAAERFCRFLIDSDLKDNELLSSKVLRDNIQFQYEWLNDPTVSGMLVVIDLLANTFISRDNCSTYFNNLISENSTICFEFLPIDKITNEKIYMAMNARGLELTAFELFKSKLFKTIVNKEIEQKIDVDYTNCFWELMQNEKLIDIVLQNYIKEHARVKLFKEATEDTNTKDLPEKQNEWIQWFKDETFLNDFIKRSDALKSYAKNLPELEIVEWLKAPEYKDRTRLYALLNFLVKIESKDTHWRDLFVDWWHIVDNIVKHTNIDAANYKTNLTLMDNLANTLIDFKDDFNLFEQIHKSTFASQNSQWLQEKTKATLIALGKTSKQDIYNAEKIPVFDGNIFFLFEFANTNTTETFDNAKFKQYSKIAEEIFDKSKIKTSLFVRAALTYEMDYTEPISFHRNEIDKWLVGYASTYTPVKQWLELLRHLFADLCDNSDIEAFIRKRISEYQKQYDKLWLYHLISWEKDGYSLFDYSESKKVQMYDSSGHIYLYNKTRWTDSNILISGLRNELVKKLLNHNSNIKHEWEWGNIKGDFFRGWKIRLSRKENDFIFTYQIDKEYIRVGILTENQDKRIEAIEFEETEKEKDWVCQKKYEYSNIKDEYQFHELISKIEFEIFDGENSESILNQITRIETEF
ncbi:hypothetical protein AGMMS49965_10080 [Bacteroidia bacterium]|nr:hypothetical protein AGMMS49965_10080 [Bacteroidia bacterium]